MNKKTISLSIAFFFLSGFAQTMTVILIPYLQNVLYFSYRDIALTQVSFFMGYFLFSPLAGYIFSRQSYLLGIKSGLIAAAFASLGIFSSLSRLDYPLILLNLFVLGSAIAFLQVTGNPFVLESGKRRKANSNLCFAQSFTNVGTILAPLTSSILLLFFPQGFAYIYLTLSVAFFAAFLYAYFAALPIVKPKRRSLFLERPHLLLGFLAIAASVGIEVASASYLIKFMADENILEIGFLYGGFLTLIYWIGFFLGRLLGSLLLKKMLPEKLLFYHALSGLFLTLLILFGNGIIAAFALLSLGFCVSVFFPIIYAFVMEGAGANRVMVSGILCMGCVGGAIAAFVQGFFADIFGLQSSFAVISLLFVFIILCANNLRVKSLAINY